MTLTRNLFGFADMIFDIAEIHRKAAAGAGTAVIGHAIIIAGSNQRRQLAIVEPAKTGTPSGTRNSTPETLSQGDPDLRHYLLRLHVYN